MGDSRFESSYARIRDAANPTRELRMLSDGDVIAAIAGASRDQNPYLANVLATEAINRTHHRSAIIDAAGEGMLAVDRDLVVSFVNRAAKVKLGLPLNQSISVALDEVLVCEDAEGRIVPQEKHPAVMALRGVETHDAVEGRIRLRDGSSFPASWTSSPIRLGDEAEGAVLVFRDISARRAADEALRNSERLLRAVVTGAPVILFGLGKDGRVTLAEGRALEAAGGRSRDIVGASAFDLGRGGFGVADAARRVLAGETVEAVIDTGGSSFQTRWAPVMGDDREILGAVGVATDITNLRRAEESTRNTLLLLQATLESTPEGVLVTDLAGNIRQYNRKFLETFGIAEAALRSRSHLDVLESAIDQITDPEDVLARVREIQRHPDLEAVDVIGFKDGRMFERWSKPQVIGGGMVGCVWTFRDVTAPRALARRHLEDKERFRALFEQSMDGILAVDLVGDTLEANSAYCEMLGYTRAELVGRRALDLLAPETHGATIAEARRNLAGPHGLQTYVLIRKDGSRLVVQGKASPMMVDGKVVGAIGVVRPIDAAVPDPPGQARQTSKRQRHRATPT